MISQLISNPDAGSIKIEVSINDLRTAFESVVCQMLNVYEEKADVQRNDELLPRHDAMKLLNVKTTLTMIRWEQKGYLKPRRIGSRVFYRKSEVLAAVEQFERGEA